MNSIAPTSIALITGANKGIGFATARQLGERGWTVLVGARNEARGRQAAKELAAAGAAAKFVHLDVTEEQSAAQAATWIDAEYGRLDALVNNAGIGGGRSAPSVTPVTAMRQVYETNVFGVVTVTNAMLPLLRKAPAARIVNVSSELGSITSAAHPASPGPGWATLPYPSSKTALNMITVMYARELADTPIKVNAANPGYCATHLNGHRGYRTPEEGAEVSVHLATLPGDGPSGVLWGHHPGADGEYGVLPW